MVRTSLEEPSRQGAAGHGRKVLILQFLKSRIKNSGEVRSAEKCGIKVVRFKNQIAPVFDPSISRADLKKEICRALDETMEYVKGGSYDLVVLDEINNAVGNGYVTVSDVKKVIDAKPEEMELVFTGRNAPKALIKLADYVTEMRAIHHPAARGVRARKGIEY